LQGVFTKELDISLLSKQTDIAVHSLKDLATMLPEGLILAAVCERVQVEDVLLVRNDHRQVVYFHVLLPFFVLSTHWYYC
jgi:hydroxymethylbilane synthase